MIENIWFIDQKSKVQACVHKDFGVEVNSTPNVHFGKKYPITELIILLCAEAEDKLLRKLILRLNCHKLGLPDNLGLANCIT